MKIFFTAVQVHGIDQPDKAKDMISVQVTDEYMMYPAYLGFVPDQLHLGSFTAINQKVAIVQVKQLAGLMPSVSRSC